MSAQRIASTLWLMHRWSGSTRRRLVAGVPTPPAPDAIAFAMTKATILAMPSLLCRCHTPHQMLPVASPSHCQVACQSEETLDAFAARYHMSTDQLKVSKSNQWHLFDSFHRRMQGMLATTSSMHHLQGKAWHLLSQICVK